MDGAPSSVAIMRVVGAAGARRAGNSVGGKSAVRNVVVDHSVPEERAAIGRSASVDGFELVVVE